MSKRRGRPRSFDRAEALRRAMMAFWTNGYDGTSMSDLVAAMGINSPSIYAAFGSKETLFYEAVTLYRATDGTRIWSATMAAPSARAAIETMLRASAEEFTEPDKPKGCLIVLGAIHADDTNESVCHKLREYRAESMATLAMLLRRGIASGELKSTTDCWGVATFYITIQQGMSIQARDGASRPALLAVTECAMAAWSALTT